MKRFYSLFLLFIAIILAFSSCSDDSTSPNNKERGKAVKFHAGEQVDTLDLFDELLTIDTYHPTLETFMDILDSLKGVENLSRLFVPLASKFDYTSLNIKKQTTQLSGLVLFPFSLNKSEVSNCPVICLAHATQMLRDLAPSKFNYINIKDFEEVTIGLAIAALGYVVVMPDYQGMGDDISEFHPFCNAELLGIASADMISAIRDFATKTPDKCPFGLSNENFFIGYSEGGFVSLAATREFEKHYPNFELTGSVPMDGPYDISNTMAGVMLADTAFPVPYFLPYVIRGYQEIYGSPFSWDSVLNSEYIGKIPPLMDGYTKTDVIDAAMPQDRVLRKIFTNSFIEKLQNQNSDVQQLLYKNNLCYGWTPKTQVHLIHCLLDDCVPYNNTAVAYEQFRNVQQLTNVTKEEPELYINIGKTIHVNAAPGCFLFGMIWIAEHSK